MPLTRQAVGGRQVFELHLFTVMPELGKVVLPQYVRHHLSGQLFPDLIARLRIARVVEQIRRGEFIHHPAHFHARQLAVSHHQLVSDGNKAVRMCADV